jgi:hypothetical protein
MKKKSGEVEFPKEVKLGCKSSRKFFTKKRFTKLSCAWN